MNNEIIEKSPRIIKVGATFRVEFTSMTHDARGVCKLDGVNKYGEALTNFPIFVQNAIKGEAGIIEITEVKKTLGNGKLVKVFKDKTSPHRINPICPIYHECGGCQLMHLSYEGQLAFKREIVRQTLAKIGGITEVNVKKTIPSVDQLYYRNKVQIPFGINKGKTVCGFYRNQTHEIIPFDTCYIQSNQMSEIVKFIRNLCSEFKITGYDEVTGKGLIRHVLLRQAKNGEVMAVLVTTKKDIKGLSELATKLVKRHPEVVSVMQNVNDANTNVILGNNTYLVYGKEYIEDQLLNHIFRIGAHSFYQVNPKTTELLYLQAIKLAKLQKTDNVIDAYCGIATIGISLADSVNHVYGVEIVSEAINNAKTNISVNKLDNIDVVCAKTEDQIIKWRQNNLKIDAIFVDPPRKGLEKSIIETIDLMQILKVVYISCDVATLARDLKQFIELGYEIKTVQPVDMFPQTLHIETVVCLERK